MDSPFENMKLGELEQLLNFYKKNLDSLEEQAAKFGLFLPVYIKHDIEDTKEKIKLITQEIERKRAEGETFVDTIAELREDLEKIYRYSEYYHPLIERAIKQFAHKTWNKVFYFAGWSEDKWNRRWEIANDDFNKKMIKKFKSESADKVSSELNSTLEHTYNAFVLHPFLVKRKIKLLIMSGMGVSQLHCFAMAIDEVTFDRIYFALDYLHGYALGNKSAFVAMEVDQLIKDGVILSRAGAQIEL